MSKRWRARLIIYPLLIAGLAGGSWWALKNAWPEREPDESGVRRDVIFAPTPPEAIDKMIELASVTKDDVVYDLGCGDGRILTQIAKKCGCKAVGWEIDPKLVEKARSNAEAAGVAHLVEIHKGDLFNVDLKECTVLAIYLLPELNARLIPQIQKMRPGSRIVSYAFNMPSVRPKKVMTFSSEKGFERTVYFWTTPLDME